MQGMVEHEGRPIDKARLCRIANEVGRTARYRGAPVLSPDSARETLIAWMQWNDPNGVHTDELAELEGFDPYTLESAWEAFAAMIEDS